TDAEVIAPGAPIAHGRAAIAAVWKGAMGGVKDVSLETRAVESAGDFAVEDGTAKLTAPDGSVSADRYIVVWKREGGTWKLHRDIWNSPK
ncbi:MAG: YybH family protein, partial [Solirubrobacteraceae bacterium]